MELARIRLLRLWVVLWRDSRRWSMSIRRRWFFGVWAGPWKGFASEWRICEVERLSSRSFADYSVVRSGAAWIWRVRSKDIPRWSALFFNASSSDLDGNFDGIS